MEAERINSESTQSQETNKLVDGILENMMDGTGQNYPTAQFVDNVSTNGDEEGLKKIEYYVQTANAKILLNTLAPEVSKNEEKKRVHKVFKSQIQNPKEQEN